MNDEKLDARRAVEALRGGVPSPSAVRRLGSHQPKAEQNFSALLDRLNAGPVGEAPGGGLLLQGQFGAGKSHLLEGFKDLALQRRFVASMVAIGKETTLQDLHRVFEAAVESAEAVGVWGPLIEEVAYRRLLAGSATLDAMRSWAASAESGLPALFAATIDVFASPNIDRELKSRIARFWSGEKLSIPEVKKGLAGAGLAGQYEVRAVPQRELGRHRFMFASRLLHEVGFAGWVLLLDEVEQINKYSPLQRGRAYAEVARWIGQESTSSIPGVVAVLAITDDYRTWAFDEKGDLETIPQRLAASFGADPSVVKRAEAGMNLLRLGGIPLRPPDDDALKTAFRLVRDLYVQAYAWEPPSEPPLLQLKPTDPIRRRVRGWVNSWDLLRIYGESAAPKMVTEDLPSGYGEDPDFEGTAEDAEADAAAVG